MTKKVFTLTPEVSLIEAAKLLAKNKVSGAPVVKDGKLVGIISTSDILKAIEKKIKVKESKVPDIHLLAIILLFSIKDALQYTKHLEKIVKIKVKDVMSKDVYSISPNDTILKAAEIMEKYDINRLPVVEKGKLVGIIARADIIRALVE